jgi:hypothetical protein
MEVKRGKERFAAFEITPDDYRTFWKWVKESTSSSLSGLHFGIYKAAVQLEAITFFLSDKISVSGSYGCPPSRWGCGLQVMLEKIAGVALVNKLRAILLMEADYNFYNKFVFGFKALDILYDNSYIPEDQYSQRESTAEDARLDNRLTMDLSRQQRIPLAAVLVDADKCYDRINHIIMSLALLSIVGTSSLIIALLYPIQTMKFFQRTAWGDSKSFMGGRTKDNPLQGLCQGNGAAPACWLMISSILMHGYSRAGFGSSILSPISELLIRFLGEMFVDDTDLIITQPHYRTSNDVRLDVQKSVDMWAYLLNSTGGSLNPEKCYWYMVDYVCIDGEWKYAPQVDWQVTIPMPDGSKHPITQLDVTESQKMLGVWSNPTGIDSDHLKKHVIGKYRTWVDRSSNGHLPNRYNHTSYKYKLWPGLRYGLATLATPTSQLHDLLRNLDYRTLPLLGVNCSIKREWRTLPRAFGGIRMYDLAVEQMIGWANMVLQHYGAPTTLGQKLKATLEALQVEIGCNGNPLSEQYNSHGILTTPSWIKSVWERSNQFNLEFILDYNRIHAPRKNDITIIELLLSNGVTGLELRKMNKCRLKLHAIFLSDITTASGRYLEEWVFGSRKGRQSRIKFHCEDPNTNDWDLWDTFWVAWLNRNGTVPHKLGHWINNQHQQWDWFFDKQLNILWNHSADGWLRYEFDQTGRNTRENQTYTLTGRWNTISLTNLLLASTREVDGQTQLVDTGRGKPCITMPDKNFWDYANATEHA